MSPPRSLRRGEFIRPPSSARPVPGGAPTSWAIRCSFAVCRSEGGRRVLAREAVLADAFAYDAALSSAGTTGCALPGAAPTLGLLKGTRDRVVWTFWNSDSYKAPCSFDGEQTLRRRRTPLSEGRMESARRGASGMDAARGVKGHGWPLYAGPRSVDGMREVERSETRMQGQDLLVPLGGAGHPATAKRDSPSRAKPMPWPTSAIGPKPQAKKSPRASSLVQNPAASPASGFLHPVAPRRDSNEKRPLVCA